MSNAQSLDYALRLDYYAKQRGGLLEQLTPGQERRLRKKVRKQLKEMRRAQQEIASAVLAKVGEGVLVDLNDVFDDEEGIVDNA